MKIINVRLTDLKPYAGNAKLHPPEQVHQIAESIREFGNNDPIAIDQDGVIIEGHGRYLALQELGYEYAECIRLDHLTDEQRRAYTLVHNQLTMNTDFDLAMLEAELEKIKDIDMGAFDLSLDDIHLEDNELESTDEVTEVRIPEVHEGEPRTKRGQIWRLGPHRLMIGDSTSAQDVEKLMGGAEADMLLTDPPYNVNYEGAAGKIMNDNLTDSNFQAFLSAAFTNASHAMRPGAAFYIWHADTEGYNFRKAVCDTDLLLKQCLIWKKNLFVLGMQDYQWIHEPCLYGWKEGAAHYFVNDRKQTTCTDTSEMVDFKKMKKDELVELLEHIYSDEVAKSVIEEDKPRKSDLHPTMKPIRLMATQIRNSTKPGWCVLDLFGGSGSTLIACEQMHRISYTMELDTKYADTILKRWEDYTGRAAELIE